jgi:hypothetical protein
MTPPILFHRIVLFTLALGAPVVAMAHGVSATDQQLLADGGLFSYLLVGAKHMLTGYDHLLFLVGVVFFLQKFRDILWFVTAFTVGHSITLTGATFLGLQANDHLIDAIIALTVLYKGFENLGGFKNLLQRQAPHLAFMVFLFGLIHGFGLSTRLQQLSIGQEVTFGKILAFNAGVELGQIVALVPILWGINYWRNRPGYTRFQTSANWGLVAAGLGLFVFQMVGLMGHLRG